MRSDRRRGSALVTAVLFAALIMSLMGTYMQLSSGEYRIATRSFLANSSFNLAEGGIDLALDAIQRGDSSGWAKASDKAGKPYWARAFGDFDLGGNTTGEIKVVIMDPGSSNPEIYSEGVAYGHIGGVVSKQLYASLTSGFLPFRNGFNTKKGMVLSGNNVTFDSYDSRVGNYGWGNRNSEITIATISVGVDSINIGNADVYGYVATGGQLPDVGPNGSITTYDNPGRVDWSRVTTDFYAEFPNVSAPLLSSPSTSLPTNGNIMGGEYLLNNWNSSGRKTLNILGDTTIVIRGNMKLSGRAAINILNNASVRIYADGDLDIGGNGILNSSQNPGQLMIFGTDTTEGSKTLKIHGNGYLAAAVYAPNANVELKGGGSSGRVYGSIVAYDAKLTGNSHFSFDEALADYSLGSGGYEIDEWVELAGVSLTSMSLNMAEYGL